MQNISKCEEIMKYCQKSMTSGNPHVITAAIQVLTNLMLETQRIKESLNGPISRCMSSVDKLLSDKAATKDSEAIKDILKCQCQMLWNNHSLGKWIKEEQALFIVETWDKLYKQSNPDIQACLEDLLLLCDITDKNF